MSFYKNYLNEQEVIRQEQIKYYEDYEKKNQEFQKEIDSGIHHNKLLKELDDIEKSPPKNIDQIDPIIINSVEPIAAKIDDNQCETIKLLKSYNKYVEIYDDYFD